MAPKPNSVRKFLKTKKAYQLAKTQPIPKPNQCFEKPNHFTWHLNPTSPEKVWIQKKANQLAKTQPISKPNRFFQKPNLFQINWLGF